MNSGEVGERLKEKLIKNREQRVRYEPIKPSDKSERY